MKEIGDEGSYNPVNAVKHKKGSRHKKSYPTCKYCGGKHELHRTHCPAYGKTCYQYGNINHFGLQGKKGVKLISVAQKLPTEEGDDVKKWELLGMTKKDFFVPLCLFHKQGLSIIKCQLDTGAICNEHG